MSRRSAIVLVLLGVLSTTVSPGAVRAADPSPSATEPSMPPAAPLPPSPGAKSPPATPEPVAPPSATADSPPAGSVVLADGTVLPPMPPGQPPSVHAEMLAEHAADGTAFGLGGDPTVLLDRDGSITSRADDAGPSVLSSPDGVGAITALPNGMRRQVLGFLPYWMLDSETLSSMNYQLVSTVAYFSVGALSTGNLDKGTSSAPSTGWAGWRSPAMTTVIDRTHAAGGKVVLTVTMMAWDSAGYGRMRTLLTSSANRARLVTQIVDAVASRGADGVNLDFELVPTDMRAQYTSFVRQLKAALVKAGVGALTVCTTGGAASWATGFDVPALTASGAADALFVMGYDFNWSGSTRAGGVAPIDSPYALDVSTALADFLEQAPASKLIWGVPYYGRGWKTTSSTLNGVTAGGSFSYFYTGHRRDAATYGRRWDSVGQVPWYRYFDEAKDSWIQVYYDDAASLAVKYDLVNRYKLAGTGMWTLLMDAGRPELWRLLADKFVTDTAPPAGGVTTLPERTTSLAIPVSWNAIDYASGLDRYNVQVRDRASSTWSAFMTGTRATSGVYIGLEGHAYEFRVQAIDVKGNAQPWRTAPGKQASVRPGYFARATTTVNVRSGAGTGYAVTATLGAADRVYVMSGPVTSGGFTWFQVQYEFAEWPSAEYPRIGWVALGSDSETYLVPAYAPGVTRIDPFIEDYDLERWAFSPNGDGVLDVFSVEYVLPQAVDSMRVDIVDASDDVVRRLDLPAQAAGWNRISWNGRVTDGSAAPDGRYLIKIFVTDDGATHAAPSPVVAANVLARWGFTLDTDAPAITATSPADGAGMLPAAATFTVTFDEPMMGLMAATVPLEAAGGGNVTTSLSWTLSTRTLRVVPVALLDTEAAYRLSLGAGVTDHAGNPLPAASIEVTTAPGEPFAPQPRLTVEPGTHTGYRIGANGDVTASKAMSFAGRSGASVGQRALLPNLPGRWLYVSNGGWAGMWVPEAPGTFLAGQTELTAVPTTTRLTFAAGTHTGYRFDEHGAITGRRTAGLAKASGANVSKRATINGRAYWWVLNGVWGGWWMPESTRSHRAGFVDQMAFATRPRILFAPGTYTGYTYSASGSRSDARTAALGKVSGAPVAGWAVINGRAHVLVDGGIWDGLWVAADKGITLAP